MGTYDLASLFDLAKKALPGLLLTAIVPMSTAVSAYDWSTDYTLSGSIERNDNYRLTETNQVETTSTSAGVSGELRGADERSSVRAGLGVNGTNYSESSIDDTESYDIFFVGKRKGERWLTALDLGYTLEPLSETEFLDTGRRIDGERKSFSVIPSANYQVDERNSLFGSYKFNDVSYDTVSLTGYTDNSVTAGWAYSLTEISRVSLSSSLSEFDPEDGDTTTVTSLNLGYDSSFSTDTKYGLKLGIADRDAPSGRDQDGNSSFNLEHRVDERNGLTFFVGNGYESSGGGEVRYTTRMNLGWDHAFSERLGFQLGSEGVDDQDENRKYYDLTAGLSWAFSRELIFGANYRYRNERSDTNDADSNSVFFSLTYSPVSEWSHEL